MTCVAACVGLLPAAFSTAIGSQVQRPLAVVVVGGIMLAPFLILTVLPVLIGLFSRRQRRRREPRQPPWRRRRDASRRSSRRAAALCAACSAGCTMGPDFQPPDPPKAQSFLPDQPTEFVAGGIHGGEAQRIVRRPRYSRPVVAGVPVAAAQRPDRDGAARQSRHPGRRRRAAGRAGERPRPARHPVPDRAGGLRRVGKPGADRAVARRPPTTTTATACSRSA